jgi:hypothetical protein
MGIEKFKSFEEAERALWCIEPDAKYYKQVAQLWNLANRLCPPNFPRGIFKYRTIEEANKQKDEWILVNALKNSKVVMNKVKAR